MIIFKHYDNVKVNHTIDYTDRTAVKYNHNFKVNQTTDRTIFEYDVITIILQITLIRQYVNIMEKHSTEYIDRTKCLT